MTEYITPKLSWKQFLTKLFPQKGMFSFSETKQMKIGYSSMSLT